MVDIMASVRLHTSPYLIPHVQYAGCWQVSPSHTFSGDSNSKTGSAETVMGARRRAAEAGLGRQKIEKGQRRTRGAAGKQPSGKENRSRKKCYAI